MSSSFPTSWEPYGSSQQNSNVTWRRTATLPSQQPVRMAARWQSSPDVRNSSPLPSLDHSQRIAPQLSAFQANDREQKSAARFEALRDEVRQVATQIRQLGAAVHDLRASNAQPISALLGEVGRTSQLLSDLIQQRQTHPAQFNLDFAIAASEKRLSSTVIAVTGSLTALRNSFASLASRLETGLASSERLIQTTSDNIAAHVPKWFEVAFEQMVNHRVKPAIAEAEQRIRFDFENRCGAMLSSIERNVNAAVGKGTAQVLDRISLQQATENQPSSIPSSKPKGNSLSKADLGFIAPKNDVPNAPSQNGHIPHLPNKDHVAKVELLVPIVQEPVTGLRNSSEVTSIAALVPPNEAEQGRAVSSSPSIARIESNHPITSGISTSFIPKSSSVINKQVILADERQNLPPPKTLPQRTAEDSKSTNDGVESNQKKTPLDVAKASKSEDIDIFDNNEELNQVPPSKTVKRKRNPKNASKSEKQRSRGAKKRDQSYSEQAVEYDTDESESHEESEEDKDDESEWECDESGSESQSSAGSRGRKRSPRSAAKRSDRSFVRRSKRRRRT